MKAKDISTKTQKELATLETELRSKITQARLDMGSRKSNDVKTIHRLKKDLSRTLTFMNAKQPEKKDE